MKRFDIEIEQEEDGRWIAEVMDLPGAMAYGPTREKAIAAAQALALRAGDQGAARPGGVGAHRLVD